MTTLAPPPSATERAESDPAEVLGSTVPRLWTPPLVTGPPGPCGCGCALTPATSYGFREVNFATETLRRAKWPWQRWLSIHAGELRADGIPRFRRLIVEVGRQAGKTREVEDLTLYWIFEDGHASILGTSTLTKYAKKPWMNAFKAALKIPELRERMGPNPDRKAIRKAAGEEEWWTEDDCHYAIAASNAEGGRSMSNKRVIADEFAKQYTYDAYGAAYYSMDAFEDAQYWALTTPDPKGEPYKDLRAAAEAFIKTGEGDPSLGLFSWSSPKDADPTDPRALAMANPTFGRPGGKSRERLLNEARAAKATGGLLLRTFKTEVMCIQVGKLDPAFDLEAYADCLELGGLDALRGRVAMVWDASPDLLSVVLYAAAVRPDGRVQVDAVKAWAGPGCTRQAITQLPALMAKMKPRALGWLPDGPGATLAADMKPRPGVWPPPGVNLDEIKAEVPAVCMGFDELIQTRQLVRSGRNADGEVVGDPLLDSQVEVAEWKYIGNKKVISRQGDGHVNAVYAAAGAAHLARTLPPDLGPFIIR